MSGLKDVAYSSMSIVILHSTATWTNRPKTSCYPICIYVTAIHRSCCQHACCKITLTCSAWNVKQPLIQTSSIVWPADHYEAKGLAYRLHPSTAHKKRPKFGAQAHLAATSVSYNYQNMRLLRQDTNSLAWLCSPLQGKACRACKACKA